MSHVLVLFVALLLGSGELAAQEKVEREPQGRGPERALLERRFRLRFEQVLKQRLALTDAQLAGVIEVNARLDAKRRELFMEERTVRKEMRDVLTGEEKEGTGERVSQLLDRAMRVQHLRLDLVESEQRELASFLSPVQRAKYLGFQEQLRRRADDMRRRAEGDSASDSLGFESDGVPSRRPYRRRPGVTR